MTQPALSSLAPRTKLAIVGTGIRGTGFWAAAIKRDFSDLVEIAALCDINPGRLEWSKQKIGLNSRTFTNFDDMMREVKPEVVIVTTVDSTHDEFIVKAMEKGADVITEKPMTTDDLKCQAILDAEKRTGKKVIVAFNYRHGPHVFRIKEMLADKSVGALTSVDFNWMLNVYHGADYFRRWHGITAKSGSLWVHKATHHFDLLNWWINSEPVEVSAFGALEHYGKNNPFRGTNCRSCDHKKDCRFYWDINSSEWSKGLYVQHEKHDGYIRDSCVWREEIDIFDKMSAQIRYANGVVVNYSLTTYSPYEGWRVAFNGKNGRMESWADIPYISQHEVDQANRHDKEMSQDKKTTGGQFNEIMLMDNFAKAHRMIKIPLQETGHGGGDERMLNRIFRNTSDNPYNIVAGTRDGAMSLLIGVAARKSIELNRPVKITELTDLVPRSEKI